MCYIYGQCAHYVLVRLLYLLFTGIKYDKFFPNDLFYVNENLDSKI